MKHKLRRVPNCIGLAFVLLLVCISFRSWEVEARLEKVASGSFRPLLPSLKSQESPTIYYPKPNVFQVRGVRYCGDADVAHYSHNNPQVSFAPTSAPEIKTVIGYWVVPELMIPADSDEATDSMVPQEGSWFAAATAKIPVDQDYVKEFRMINKTSDQVQSGFQALINNGIRELLLNTEQAYGHNTKYRVYAAAMACDKLSNVEGTAKVNSSGGKIGELSADYPRSTQIVAGFLNLAGSGLQEALNSDLGLKKFDLTPNSDGSRYKFSFSKKSKYDASSDSLYQVSMDIADIKYPGAKDLEGYKKALASAKGKTESNLNVGGGCEGNLQTKPLWFEPIPMNIPCRVVRRGLADQRGSLTIRLKEMFEPTSLPTKAEFEERRDKLVLQVRAAAFIRQGLYAVNSDPEKFPRSVARCFESGAYINSVLGSIVFPLEKRTDKILLKAPASEMVHPEGLYAEVDYKKYHGPGGGQVSGGNAKTVFKMTGAKASSGVVVVAGKKSNPLMEDRSANFSVTIKVRSIGCAQNIYCRNTQNFLEPSL